jgi:hypothetical protein
MRAYSNRETQVEHDIVTQALTIAHCLTPSALTTGDANIDVAKVILVDLATAIQTTAHPTRLEELLHANDVLTEVVAAATSVPPKGRPVLTLQGLRIREFDNNPSMADEQTPDKKIPSENGQAMHATEDLEGAEESPKID